MAQWNILHIEETLKLNFYLNQDLKLKYGQRQCSDTLCLLKIWVILPSKSTLNIFLLGNNLANFPLDSYILSNTLSAARKMFTFFFFFQD